MSPPPHVSIEPWFSLRGAAASATGEAAQLDLLIAGAELAAECGCRRVWLEGMQGLALSSDSLRLALWVAGQIQAVRVVATGIRVEPSLSSDAARSWIRLAEDAATADGICGGRLELAFGSSGESGESSGALADVVRFLRDAWSGAPVSLNDADDPIEIYPRPCKPDGPKLWVRVETAAAARAAAEADLSVVVSDLELARAHAAAAAARGDTSHESAFLREGARDPARAAQPLVAALGAIRVTGLTRLVVPAESGRDAESAWLARVEDAFGGPSS